MQSLCDNRIGFIGLGNMGKPMAGHLMRAGARLTLFNRSKQVLEELAGEEAEVASCPHEVAERVGDGLIFLSLPNAGSVAEVVEGEDGLFEGLTAGSKVVDMGSTAVEPTRAWHERALGMDSDWSTLTEPFLSHVNQKKQGRFNVACTAIPKSLPFQ